MENEKIQTFLLSNGKYLPVSEIDSLSVKLQSLEDEASTFRVHSLNFKNPTVLTLLYWLIPGFACIDRFFINGATSGFKKLFSLIGLFALFLGFGGIFRRLEISSDLYSGLSSLVRLSPFIVLSIWLVVDGFTIYGRVKKFNLSILLSAIKKGNSTNTIKKQDTKNATVISNTTDLDQLEKLHSLKEKGIITEDEFNAKKKEILHN